MVLLASSSNHINGDWLVSVVPIALVCSAVTYLVFKAQPTHKEFWKSQSWVGMRDEWFAGLRANTRAFTNIRALSEAGYNKFSKSKRAFAIPMFGSDPWIVLPPSATKELLDKPDSEVDAGIVHHEQTQIWYTQGQIGMHISANNLHFDVVRRQLTRKLPLLTADVYDELRVGFETYWSRDKDSTKSINVYRTCTKIVSRAANRVFVGDKLCRNEDFLEHCRLYTEGVFGGAALINLVPKMLRPLVAPVITYPNRKNERICMQTCLPVVKERLDHTLRKCENAEYEWTPPVDALQWLIEECLKEENLKELKPEIITFRLLMLNMVAIHTTSMTITNTVLDLYSSPNAEEFVAGLREECTRVLEEHGGEWTKQAINELFRVDSTIKESMRRSDLGWLAVNRMVIADGVTFQDDIHVPKGVRVCIPAHAIHRDENLYPSPLEFDAFRFARLREASDAQKSQEKKERASTEKQNAAEDGESQRSIEHKNNSLITTSDDFLAFGHGRHACPGRFFAIQELKLMLAYLVMHYDVEQLPERPENACMNGMSIPPANALLQIRRTEQHVQ